MLSKKLWFLDLTTEELGGKDVICLWMVDENGIVINIYDPGHRDWVYVDADINTLRKIYDLVKLRESAGLTADIVKRKLVGRDKEVLLIRGPPKDLENVVRIIEANYRDVTFYEDDIRFSNKYLLIRDVSPSSWYKVTYDVESNINILRDIQLLSEEVEYPPLKILSIDLVTASPIGEADPESDPILAVTLYTANGYKQYVLRNDDKEILKSLVNDVQSYSPHVIVSFEGNSIVWPYLLERSKVLNIPLKIGYRGDEPHQSLYGHFSIPGRLNIDLKDYVNNNPSLQRKTLEELAYFLGISQPGRVFDRLLYYDAWKNNRDELLKYSLWRAKTIYDAFMLLKEEIFSLSAITGMPADYVLSSSAGFQVENYIMKNAVKRGELIIKVKGKGKGTYLGGLVLPPKVGIHRNVCVIDFKSMYPTLIMKYNISPDTIVYEKKDDVKYFEEIGVGVKQSIKGLFPEIIKRLVDERNKVRSKMKEFPEGSAPYRILDAHQRVLKILANAMYGYMGWINARYYSWEGAQLVTYLGRETISSSKRKAEELGLHILYGDTDSLFVNYDKEKVEALLTWISKELGLEAKIDKIYKVLLFTEAKKRYAGLTIDDKIDVVGLEYVRRDWCNYAKETQYNLIKLVLTGASKDKILDYFRERVRKLDRGEVPIDELVIWEQITKRLDEYKAMSPHLAVAEELALKGWKIKKGMFIGYVILKGSGPLYKRAIHYTMAKKEDIDWDYYIYRQVIPVSARVLEPMGISKSDLESIASGLHFSMDRFLF